MEPNWNLSEGLEQNSHKFDHEFFKRYSLREHSEPIKLNKNLAKNYVFPTFYSDVSCAIGIFLCDYDAAQGLMIAPDINPIKMPYNRSLVIFSAYQYKNVYNIKPYNEIAMTIPIMAKAKFSPPILPMLLSSYFKKFGYYVFSMPVTSYENELRGHKIWGLPKKTQKIAIRDSMDHSHVVTGNKKEGSLSLSIPVLGKKQHFDETSPLYTRKDNQILKSFTSFKGDFNVNKNTSLIFKRDLDYGRGSSFLTFDPEDYPVLENLRIHTNPIQTRYTQSMNSCFDLPTKF